MSSSTACGSVATPSIAVLTRRVTGMVNRIDLFRLRGKLAGHEVALPLRSAALTGLPAGVLTGLPSSRTEKPSAAGSTVTAS